MSKCLVEVCQIDKISPHNNADKLEILTIKGWQCVTAKKQFKDGEKVVYFPPDTCIPEAVSDKLGVTQYLGKGGRIKSIKLRGEPSFGLAVKLEDQSLEVGTDMSSQYSATKYEPPVNLTCGGQNRPARKPKSWLGRFVQKYTWKLFNVKRDTAEEVEGMPKYTDIENLRNYKNAFEDSEPVVITEKIHGTNVRIAIVNGEEMAGSHNVRRLRPDKPMTFWRAIKRALRIKEPVSYGDEIKNDTYWYPWSLDSVRKLMSYMTSHYPDTPVVLYGEVYGKVQELKYGHPGDIAFRAFDIMVGGTYVNPDSFAMICDMHGVERVPVLYEGPYFLSKVRECAQGKTTMPGADHMREGCVVRPKKERCHPRIGRVVMKYIGDEYLCSKGYNENKDV